MMGENREIHEVWGEASVEPILNAHYAHALMNRGDVAMPAPSWTRWASAGAAAGQQHPGLVRGVADAAAGRDGRRRGGWWPTRSCAGSVSGIAPNPAWIPWRSLRAKALDRMGRTDEAIDLAEQELVAARAWGSPRVVGSALRILGALRRAGGHAGAGAGRAVLEGSTARLEYARALASLGTALRLDRRPTEAREPLSTGARDRGDRRGRPAGGARPRRARRRGRPAARQRPDGRGLAHRQRATGGRPGRRGARRTRTSPRRSTSPRRRSRCT